MFRSIAAPMLSIAGKPVARKPRATGKRWEGLKGQVQGFSDRKGKPKERIHNSEDLKLDVGEKEGAWKAKL